MDFSKDFTRKSFNEFFVKMQALFYLECYFSKKNKLGDVFNKKNNFIEHTNISKNLLGSLQHRALSLQKLYCLVKVRQLIVLLGRFPQLKCLVVQLGRDASFQPTTIEQFPSINSQSALVKLPASHWDNQPRHHYRSLAQSVPTSLLLINEGTVESQPRPLEDPPLIN